MDRDYDVIIMGGGPSGATLAAILARRTQLKVALFEKEFFPRERIGESLSATVMPVLAYSGALPKIFQSDFYSAPKPGGFFAWDPGFEDPWIAFFNRDMYDELGVLNFSIHVNRSEFDKLLLDHAREMGADVHEGTPVVSVQQEGDLKRVQLEDGSQATCRIFVEASGRKTSIMGVRKQFLSDYKNIAIWNHFVGTRLASELPGDWNIYRRKQARIPGLKGEDWSPVASFACDDGWFWYIPVPKMVMGKRVLTHSVGLVTDPKILSSSPDKHYTDMSVFMAKVRQVPLLRDLMADAQPVSDKVLTATNYSMISDEICSYDQGWILVGDAAFFVDPLFSTGVGLAITGAGAASFLISATLDTSLPEQLKRDLWYDYQQRLRTIAITMSVCVDQWYHGIARKNPASSFWQDRRGAAPDVDLRFKSFYHLGSSEVLGLLEYDYTGDRQRWVDALKDLWPWLPGQQHFIKPFWQSRVPQEPLRLHDPLDGLRASDPRRDTLRIKDPDGDELAPDTIVSLHPDVSVRSSILLGQFLTRDMVPPEFWKDPLSHTALTETIPHYYDCGRCFFKDRPDDVEVPFLDEFEDASAVLALLRDGSHTYAQLKQLVAPKQRSFIGRLHNAGMLLMERHADDRGTDNVSLPARVSRS